MMQRKMSEKIKKHSASESDDHDDSNSENDSRNNEVSCSNDINQKDDIMIADFPSRNEEKMDTTVASVNNRNSSKALLHATGDMEGADADDGHPAGSCRVYNPAPADILLGRGKPFQSHPGNQWMLEVIESYREPYQRVERSEKQIVIEEVLDKIKVNGGRFLMKVDYQKYWVEVDRNVAYRKIGHAFRSKRRNAAKSKRGVSVAKTVASHAMTTEQQANNNATEKTAPNMREEPREQGETSATFSTLLGRLSQLNPPQGTNNSFFPNPSGQAALLHSRQQQLDLGQNVPNREPFLSAQNHPLLESMLLQEQQRELLRRYQNAPYSGASSLFQQQRNQHFLQANSPLATGGLHAGSIPPQPNYNNSALGQGLEPSINHDIAGLLFGNRLDAMMNPSSSALLTANTTSGRMNSSTPNSSSLEQLLFGNNNAFVRYGLQGGLAAGGMSQVPSNSQVASSSDIPSSTLRNLPHAAAPPTQRSGVRADNQLQQPPSVSSGVIANTQHNRDVRVEPAGRTTNSSEKGSKRQGSSTGKKKKQSKRSQT